MLDLMAGRVSSPVFVGRLDELNAIESALERAAAGETVTLLVAGEAGVGKTRLTGEASGTARERGFRVLRGECVNVGGSSLPYAPFVEALRGLIAELDPSELAAIAGPAAPDLARLVPGFGSEGATVPRQLEWVQARLFEALLGLLSRLADRSPVLLVIEDLHWADSATREAFDFLVRALRTTPALLLGTYRSDELHRRHPLLPWLAELERGGRVERLAVARFARPDIAEMLTSIVGYEPRSEIVDEVFLRSDGNPFFAEELLAAGSSERTGQPLTPTLREVLLAHVATVPEVAANVLRVAAVAGRRVDHDLLAGVAGLPDDRLNAGLQAAVDGHLLIVETEGGAERFAFRHALVQEAVYDDLLPGERRSLHRAFAETLDRQVAETGASEAGRLAELAHHWAAAREDRRAFEASLRAAEAAMSSLAFGAALREYERALELWDGLEGAADIADFDRIELLRRAGRAAYMAAEDRRAVAHRREAVAASDPVADPARSGLLREELARALWVFGDTPAALEMYRAAVATMPVEPPSAARARALGGLAQILMLIDRYHEAIALSEEAIAMARATGASAEESHALNTRGRSRSLLGDCAGGLADLREGLRIALDVRQADDIGRGIVNLTDELHDCGETTDAVQEVALGIQIADEYGIGHMYGYYIRLNGVNAAYAVGRWQEARRLLEEALARGPSGSGAEIYRLANTLPFLVGQGSFEIADIGIARATALLDNNPGAQFIGPVHAAAAERALWRHAPQDAIRLAVTGMALLADTEDRLHRIRLCRIGAWAAGDLAVMGQDVRDDSLVAEARDRIADFGAWLDHARRAVPIPDWDREVEATQATLVGEASRVTGDVHPAVWGEIADRWTALGRPYVTAYARWREAETALLARDRPRATRSLEEALAIAGRLGAAPLLEAVEALGRRARIVMADTGSAPDERQQRHPSDQFGLTTREREVLSLLVDGRSNRQIADLLFISENTAGVHVSRILGKLGVASRGEAAAFAYRQGLVPPASAPLGPDTPPP